MRWYQAAAWHPFFRGHAHEQTLRREPYLLPVEHRRLVRDALHRRQAFAPYVYTLFFENERLGLPVLRPLWAEFPVDAAAFDVDDAFLLGTRTRSCTHQVILLLPLPSALSKTLSCTVGSAILVHPIVNEMDLIPQKKMQFYLPSGGNEQSSGPTIVRPQSTVVNDIRVQYCF